MSVYSDFNAFCTTNFGALAEPLVKATFGNTPAFVAAGDWTYPSRNSASIAFETTLPCKGRVEWGTTTAYGNLTALPDRFYYNHLHYLTGLTPGVTYHYRLVAVECPSLPAGALLPPATATYPCPRPSCRRAHHDGAHDGAPTAAATTAGAPS